jgi:4-amino-4-deoxy-L-arabinose transferase-like glycosyltransferase
MAGFCLFLFFYGLGSFGLLGADEPRYAQVAREMLERRDWVVPTLGGQTWLEKPPLLYWQAMLAYAVFGVSDWAARLTGALDATLLVLGVYFFLRRLRPGFELDGALMTASTAALVGFAHAASTDMPLAAMFTLAMLSWYLWWETSRRAHLAGFYVSLALAMLAKGPVAPCLAGAVIVSFALAARDSRALLRSLWIPGMMLFALVALPWYVAIQVRRPEFFRVFFLEHNLARFSTNLYRHEQPFWFFVPVLLLGLIPWVVFIAVAVGETVRAWWSEPRTRSADTLNLFLVLWLIVPVLFFSLSRSKLPGYILPAIPAGPLLLAEYVRRRVAQDERPSPWLIGLHAVTAVSPVVPALMIQYVLLQHRLPWNRGTIIASTVTLTLAVGIALTLASKLGLRFLRFVTLIPAVIVVAALIKIGAPWFDADLSARPVARELAQMETTTLPLAVFDVKRETEYGLAFYCNQSISRYELHQVPLDQHLVVAPRGSMETIRKIVGQRRVSYLGTYPPQALDYYWVAKGSN